MNQITMQENQAERFIYTNNSIILSQNRYNMDIKKSQLDILNLFRKNIFLSETIRSISIKIKKPYQQVHRVIQELKDKKILSIKEVGKGKVCELALSNETISVLSFLDEQEALERNITLIKDILQHKELLDDIVLVTGSYTKGTETKKSDIDLVVITKEDAFSKQRLIENLTALLLPKVHPIAITQKDFVSMLTDKKASFGKEIFKQRLIYRGASRYYELIKEAIDNGFRD